MQSRNNLEQYNHLAKVWWDQNGLMSVLRDLNPGRFSFCDTILPDMKNKKVLDIGCGGGFTCEFLASRGALMTGIDRAEVLLNTARAHALQSNLAIDYQLGDAMALTFSDAAFDVVTCFDVLEHITNWKIVLSEVFRVLKPGGFFFFDTVNRNFLSRFVLINVLEDLLREIPKGTHDPEMFIKPAEMRIALDEVGFKNVKTTGLVPTSRNFKTGKTNFKARNWEGVFYVGAAQVV